MTTPEANRPLTSGDVRLLKAGDVLRCVKGPASNQEWEDVKQPCVGDVVTFIKPSGTGGVSNCIVTSFDPSFGFRPGRFEFFARPTQPDPERDGAVSRLTAFSRRSPCDTYSASSIGEDLRTVLSLLSTAERQRDEAVRNGQGLLRLIDETDEYQKRPDSGAWGVECACCMGELFDGSDRVVIEQARQALQSIGSGE